LQRMIRGQDRVARALPGGCWACWGEHSVDLDDSEEEDHEESDAGVGTVSPA